MPSSVVPSCSPVTRAQAQQFFGRRPARRDRLAVAVGVGAGQRGREAEPAGAIDSPQHARHLVELLGRGFVADGVGAHHVAAQAAVADEEPGVDRGVAVERVEVLAERLPAPRHARLERFQRHAFDLGHHAADVVAVLGADRRQRETAVAADDRGHAVHVRRRGERDPRTAGRRSACAGRRSRGRRSSPSASNTVSAASSMSPTPTIIPSARRRCRRSPERPFRR